MGIPVASLRDVPCIEWLARMVSGLVPVTKTGCRSRFEEFPLPTSKPELVGSGRCRTGPRSCAPGVVLADTHGRSVAGDWGASVSLPRCLIARREWWVRLLPLVVIVFLSPACGGHAHVKDEHVWLRTSVMVDGKVVHIPWIEHTPLQQAVEEVEPGFVLGLLDFADAGADVNTLSGDCGLPLPCWVRGTARHHQDKTWRLLVAQELIDVGADLEGQAFEHHGGEPALGYAALYGDLEMMRLLIDAGADVNGRTRNDLPILGAAMSHGLYEPRDHDKLTVGAAALKMMLDEGADPNMRKGGDGDPRFPVSYRDRRTGVVVLGFPVTPLLGAAGTWTEHHPELMRRTRLLVEYGADLNVTNQAGQTALFFAAKSGIVPMLEFLLGAGLDPNGRDRENVPPLGFAARHGHGRSVSILLAHGADPNAADIHGFTPLMFAAKHPRAPQDVTQALLSAGADPNLHTPDGGAPLMIAAAHGHIEIVRLLLKAGADPHQTHVSGKSAATLARAREHREVYDLLTDSGTTLPSVSLPEKTGR